MQMEYRPIKKEDIVSVLGSNMDLKERYMRINGGDCHIFYIEGMVDHIAISRFVIERLRNICSLSDAVESGLISAANVSAVSRGEEAVRGIIAGHAAVLYNDEAYLFDVRKTPMRSVDQPSEESAVKASKDSFVEDIKVNTALIRKKIASADLHLERLVLGRQTNTTVAIAYMDNICNTELVEKVLSSLESIDCDGVITPDVIEQSLRSSTFSFFPQTVITERPDKIAKHLLSGRCAVLVDGLPMGYILPATLSLIMSTPEDYAGNFIFAATVRLLRYFLLSISVLLPGAYVALTTYHYEMLPSRLALSIAEAKTGVPFPIIFEVLAMLALFEILIQAGQHMPKSSGQAVSIVGALVVGEAAIAADLVSPAALIIVAVSVISCFAMPNQEFANGLRLWRIIITVAGASIGLFGVVAGLTVLIAHLASLESFGVSYLAPFAGVRQIRLKDALFVVPDKLNRYRPDELEVKNKRRTK